MKSIRVLALAAAITSLSAADTASAEPDTYRVDIYGTVDWVNGNWKSCTESFDAIVAIVEDDASWEGETRRVDFGRCRGDDNGPGIAPRITVTTVRRDDGSAYVSGDLDILAPECPTQTLNTCGVRHFENVLQPGDQVEIDGELELGARDSVKFVTVLSYLKQSF
jgi:hypothetical protein